MGKGSSSSPDTAGAATIEGEYSAEAARDMNRANRPDQYNTFGNQTWSEEAVRDPVTGKMTSQWSMRENMSPEMREMFNSQMGQAQNNSTLAGSMSDRINSEMGSAPDWAQFGNLTGGPQGAGPINGNLEAGSSVNRGRAEDDAYARSTRRLDPQMAAKKQALELNLRNRGLSAGDQQYQSEMDSYNTGSNDAYEMARMGATQEGRVEDQQSFGQQMSAGQNNRAADAQDWSQQTQQSNTANALRDQQIQEYLAKRSFSKNEQDSLQPDIGKLTSDFTGG
tara:strand:+ start:27018 stop:27857 length:840 start_codon:yes stop_codon:yes gene_type:complete